MKNLILLLVLALVLSPAFAQEQQQLTPETVVYINTEDGIRVTTAGQMWQDMGSYEDQAKVTHNAYAENDNSFVIPQKQADNNLLEQQKQDFQATARNYTDGGTPTRSGYFMNISYNKQWGIENTFAAYLDALAHIFGDQASRTFHAHCYVGGYIFGEDIKVIEIDANMANNNGNSTANASFKLFGQTKWSSGEIKLFYNKTWEGEISKEATFMVGPIPVTVSGAVGGSMGFQANLSVVEGGIAGSLIPKVTAYGRGAACVDLVIARAGVDIKLDFVINNLPIVASVRLLADFSNLQIGLTVNNHLIALRGYFNVYAEIMKLTGGWKRYTKTLFNWEGIEKNWTLYSDSKMISLK